MATTTTSAPARPSFATHGLVAGFLRSVQRHPSRPALEVDGETLTYAELHARATALAGALRRHDTAAGPPLTALLAARSATAFAGVLGALLRGHGYVPLNPRFPAARNRAMLERAQARALIVDERSVALLEDLLDGIERPLILLVPERASVADLAARWPRHVVLGAPALEPGDDPAAPVGTARADALAYLLFTSGSTGTPKGVMVAQRNVARFVDVMVERYAIGPEDRLSQTFDLTFDLSAFDMFVSWEAGACLCCPPEAALMAPGRFIEQARLTVWFAVPSTGVFMRRLGLLAPGAYPGLRLVLACGEPLPLTVAQAWSQAAPHATIENLYGPTELTIACTVHRFDPQRTPTESVNGVVPIGEPFPGMRTLVVDEALREVAPGAAGELLLRGPQVTLGYWRDPGRTAAAFVVPPGRHQVHYRTGDRVRRPLHDEPMAYLGRVDHQLKVRGHRVELGEVEAALRDASGVDAVAAIGWPRTASGADGIVAFVAEPMLDEPAVLATMARRLPAYMVPRRLHLLEALPLNANGKVDRGALTRRLEAA